MGPGVCRTISAAPGGVTKSCSAVCSDAVTHAIDSCATLCRSRTALAGLHRLEHADSADSLEARTLLGNPGWETASTPT